MTKEWKPGDWAMVQVGPDAQHAWKEEQYVWLVADKWQQIRIPADCLHPLPAATISAEAQAVLDAAVKWRGITKHDSAYHVAVLSEAIDAYRASLAPATEPTP